MCIFFKNQYYLLFYDLNQVVLILLHLSSLHNRDVVITDCREP